MNRNKRQRQSIGVRSLPIILQAILQSLFALLINLLPFFPGQLRQRVEELGTTGEIINSDSDARPRHRRNLFCCRRDCNRPAKIGAADVDVIISYHNVVTEGKASLQKGMNYEVGRDYSVFLMSLRE